MMKTVGYILLFAGLMAFLTQTARSADPPAVKVEQKVQVAPAPAKAKAPCPDCPTKAKPAAPAVIQATVVVQPKAAGTLTVRVRLFERYRTGDGPVRRLFSGRFRGGC